MIPPVRRFVNLWRPRSWSLRNGLRNGAYQGVRFHVWDYPFTRPGKLLLVAFFLAGVAGAISKDIPVYQAPVTILGIVLVSSMVGSVMRWSHVTVEGHLPRQVTVGQPARGTFLVKNAGWIPQFDISLSCFALPRSWQTPRETPAVRTLKRKESVSLELELIPERRGLYRLPAVRVFTTFPFNLFRNELGRAAAESILVLPAFHPVRHVALNVGSRYQPGGLALTSNVGESPEYIGNRDYTAGDPLRRVDFRSWARLARPVVKEYQEEYYCRVALVLDTFVDRWRRPGRRGFPELEGAVSVAASVADALARSDYVIDLFAAGPELHVFRAGRHTAHFENVLEILACVGPCRTNPLDKTIPALTAQLQTISTVVCVFLDWDEVRLRSVQEILHAGCTVKVIVVRNGKTTIPADWCGGAELIQLTPAQVAGRGLDVL